MNNQIGFMQGRLVRSEKKNCIQYFPDKFWKKEINIASKNNFFLMEWTINWENINKNFLVHKNINKKKQIFFAESKVKVKSVTCDFFMQKPYFKKKYFKFRNEIITIIENLIKNCDKLKIKYIIFPLVDNSSIKNFSEQKKLIFEVNKFRKLLKKTMILFEIDYSPHKVIKFIKKFDKKKFGINYDTGNSASLGYSVEEEIKYFKFVKNIHIKDRLYNGQSVRLGEGDFQFEKFFELLKKKNYKGNFILQTARSKNDRHLFELKKNYYFLKNFLR